MRETNMNNGPTPPAKAPARFRERIEHWKHIIKFARARGGSPKECYRLFYYAGLKASLVFRGLSSYSPERLLSFSLRVNNSRTFQVFARDNGLDVGGFVEFFEPVRTMIPPDLPPLKPKVIYDLGANVGAASLYFAAIHPEARLYGFEPMPANYEVCMLNYRNLPHSRAFPWAVGARSETTVFECQNDPRGGRLVGGVANPRLQLTGKIDVQVVSIADLIQVHGLEPPEFLKIDVEGAEMEVLKGMERHAQTVKRLFVETHSPDLRNECLRWMRAKGFRMHDSVDPTALWGDRTCAPS